MVFGVNLSDQVAYRLERNRPKTDSVFSYQRYDQINGRIVDRQIVLKIIHFKIFIHGRKNKPRNLRHND